MTSRRIRIAVVVLLLAGVGGWLAVWYQSPTRRIDRQLTEIEKLMAKPPGERNLTALNKARLASELFADDFEFVAKQFDFHTRDRQQLMRGIQQYRSRAQTILMQILDREISVAAEQSRATSHVTAHFITKARDISGREAYRLQINWLEQEGEWRMDYVRLLEIIEEPPRTWIP